MTSLPGQPDAPNGDHETALSIEPLVAGDVVSHAAFVLDSSKGRQAIMATTSATPVLDTLAAMTIDSLERCGMDPGTLVLTRLAALSPWTSADLLARHEGRPRKPT